MPCKSKACAYKSCKIGVWRRVGLVNATEGSGAEGGKSFPTHEQYMLDRNEPTWIDCQACRHKPHIDTSVKLIKEPKPDILLMQEGNKGRHKKDAMTSPKTWGAQLEQH